MSVLITSDQLKKIATTMIQERANLIASLLNELCPVYGLTEKMPFRMFLANVIHESAEFSHKSENMVYTSAARIKAIWPARFPTVENAHVYVRKPEALANRVYGGRMGNTGANDGWLYRGGGFIGLTGKETFTKYATFIHKPVEETANLVRTTDRYALDSALWFFCVLKNLKCEAEKDNFRKVIYGINGGYIGVADREKYYHRAKKYIV